MKYERDFHPRRSPVISGRLGYLYGTSALYCGPVSDRIQRRPAYFPGQGLRNFPQMTSLRAFPDSSSTGGVCCAGGRIPAFCDSMSAVHDALGSTFSSAPSHYCCGLALPEGIPPVPATGPASPGSLKGPFHRVAEDAESETDPSGLSCPLSRYRPGLQIFSSVNGEVRPADRQRLLSAYPAAFAAWSMKDWLPPPFTVPPAKFTFMFIARTLKP